MDLADLLNGFSSQLEPVQKLAKRLEPDGRKDFPGAFAIGSRPLVGPDAHAMILYAPLTQDAIERYQHKFGVRIPEQFRLLLSELNGLNAFEFALFGIPQSMIAPLSLIDRSSMQPYDIGLANTDWKREYSVSRDLFHFGSGPYSPDEHVGYFLDAADTIFGYRKNGQLISSWKIFDDFLADELQRAEAEYPRFEMFMLSLRAQGSA